VPAGQVLPGWALRSFLLGSPSLSARPAPAKPCAWCPVAGRTPDQREHNGPAENFAWVYMPGPNIILWLTVVTYIILFVVSHQHA
jgi:hypothetical protein